MQLENALAGIGSAGLFGYGFNNLPIYFPEPQTDFIFSVYAISFGFIGTTLLLILLLYFDIKLVSMVYKSGNNTNKYVIGGIIGMIIYQQLQCIGMNIGLLPITGITFPYISYGGSSLLSYMIMTGLIFNISNESLRYTNKRR
jgi:rod shape determining protein RodA